MGVPGSPLPDITGEENLIIADMSYALTQMTVTDVQFSSFYAQPMAADKPEILVDIDGMAVFLSFVWDLKDTVWPYTELDGTGTVSVFLSHADAKASGVCDECAVYNLHLEQFDMTIEDIDLNLVGDGALFNEIFDMFKGIVIDVLNAYLPDAFAETIQNLMVELGHSNVGYARFGDGSFVADDRMPEGGLVTTDSTVTMKQIGTIWPTADKGALPHRIPDPMPTYIGDADYQQLTSPVTIESVFNAHADIGYMQDVVSHSSVPDLYQPLMTTSYFQTAMPDLFNDYPDMPLSLNITMAPSQEGFVYPQVDILPSGLKISLSVPISVGIEGGPQNLFSLNVTYQFAAHAVYNPNVWVDLDMSYYGVEYTPVQGGVYEAPANDALITQTLIVLGAQGIAPFVQASLHDHGGIFMYRFEIDYEEVVFSYDPTYLGIMGTLPEP
ncbi:hypothetical protein KIPB_003312 [Kipferlia bialata]|uniref:Bactericidal permeability-increasing protein, alpha/beta domain n=1 Tax=Kipferlia bialata TaxID=797122 RepID=A0A9K3CS99_9EUKA|nr:hypothetical protein KIPB_003312 [Kipferlia bialata]|eukprot:g3312.t1